MAVHAAFGGSTNLLLHIPAIAFAAGPAPADRRRLARGQPPGAPARRASCPTGPIYHPTVRAFLAGGVPEVMLHLRALGLLDETVLTATGEPLARVLDWWEASDRRRRLRDRLFEEDGVDPDDVIMSPGAGRGAGPDQHRHLPAREPRPRGLGHQEHGDRPDASSTPTASIARSARPASSPASATRSPPSRGRATDPIKPGDVLVLIGRGPMGAGHGGDLPDHRRR